MRKTGVSSPVTTWVSLTTVCALAPDGPQRQQEDKRSDDADDPVTSCCGQAASGDDGPRTRPRDKADHRPSAAAILLAMIADRSALRRPEHDRASAGRARQTARVGVRGGVRRPGPRLPARRRPRCRAARARRLRRDCSRRSGRRVHVLETEIDSPGSRLHLRSAPRERFGAPSRSGRGSRTGRPSRPSSRPGRPPPGSRRSGGSRRPARSRAATRSGCDRTCCASDGRCGPTTPAPVSSRRSSAGTCGSSTCRTGAVRPS